MITRYNALEGYHGLNFVAFAGEVEDAGQRLRR
jgi:hypothetical protein